MVRLEKPRALDGNGGGVVDLQVSTAAELPELNDTSLNIKILAGSIAQVIQEGKWYTLDDDGKWYDTTGTEAG